MKLDIILRKKARIEMLPLIDIVFLLLVFFIYAMLSMAVHRSLPVILPESSTAAIDTGNALSITVKPGEGAEGCLIFVDTRQVRLSDLTEHLQSKAETVHTKTGKTAGAMLFADKDVSYQVLFQVLDRARLAGITDISLQAAGNSARP